MVVLLTGDEMRRWETAAFDSEFASGADLMERAGRGVVAGIFAHWPDLARSPGRMVVLCGPGNNGGDGFVVARLLRGCGWTVDTFFLGDLSRLPPDARANHDQWRRLGAIVPLTEEVLVEGLDGEAVDLCVDALFGIGFAKREDPGLDALLRAASLVGERAETRRVAVDIPSALCADTGRALAAVPRADLTVTFQAPKLGHYFADGPDLCGALKLVDLGLERVPFSPAPGHGSILLAAPGGPYGPAPLSKGHGRPNQHKFDHGHALVLTGGFGRSGAARLAARAALRIGAGLVTLGAPGAAMMECASQITSLMLRRCDDGTGLATLLEDPRINALCLGPGAGVSERLDGLLSVAMASGRRLVLDADALSQLALRAEPFAGLSDTCVLTPHGGEFARLFPDLAARLSSDSSAVLSHVEAARIAAARAGCVILLKGASTVIAAPDGTCAVSAAVYDRAAPWLATAGSGDVLAGIITGLLARGWTAYQAACDGAVLHVEAARMFGPGLIAEDLPEMLPRVLANYITGTSAGE